jgi:hypothetical protein
MRIIHFIAIAAGCVFAHPGRAAADQPPRQQQPSATQPATQAWLVTDSAIAFTPVPIAFPAKAGSVAMNAHAEASHPGENLDNAIEYHSADQAVFASVYIYYPGLSHAGLAAIVQDWAIRKNSPTVTGGEMRLAAAGGVEGVAIRTAYSHYRGDLASSAAYIKADRWLVTLRVSGPEARRAEVEAAMDALLKDVRFGRAAPARPATLLALRDCPEPGSARPAGPVPDPQGPSMAAYGFLGAFDGAGMDGKDEKSGATTILPSRVPTELCRTALETKGGKVVLLRAVDGDAISIDGRTVRLALLSDSGRILEVDHAKNLGGYVLLYHDLGLTGVLGTYDAIPSDKQIADIVDGTDREGGRIRVPVRFRPGKGAEISLPEQVTHPPASAH